MAMMATKQRQQTGTWTESFPKQQVTQMESSLFVKKLLAIAVSNIAYLRVIFPERAFGDRSLEELNLKILKNDKSCPAASLMIEWLKGVFDALDKKYLRILVLGIYRNIEDPNTLVEAYTFKFSYSDNTEMSIYSNNKKITSATTADQTKKSTIALLHTLIVLCQTLKPLPDDFRITMKLFYYDDVTPEEYEPPGFKAAETDTLSFEGNPVKIRVGNVATSFHSLQLRLTTDDPQFRENADGTASNDEQVTMTSLQGLDQEPEDNQTPAASGVQHHEPHTPADDITSEQGALTNDVQSRTEEEISIGDRTDGMEDEDAISFGVCCPCGVTEEDGLMILCSVCHYWQHAVCFKIIDNVNAPHCHVCNVCCEKSGNNPEQTTDASLLGLSPTNLQMTCLWRRTIVACQATDTLTAAMLAKRLGVKKAVAENLLHRLISEGYVSSTKGKSARKTVDKVKLAHEAVNKYFSADHDTEVQKVASKTSLLELDEQKSSKSNKMTEDKVTGTASHRKLSRQMSDKVRSANNDYDFQASNTQEDFEVPQPRRKRFKSSEVMHHEQ